jgi:hypothetical protein
MGRERVLFLPFLHPFGVLVYPDGRVGVIHRSAWKGNSRDFAQTAFSEVRRFVATLMCIVPWRTYIPLRRVYAAFVTWPDEAA